MAEYIEKEKAARILREEAAAHYPTAFHVGLYAAARAIDAIPAADVRPVVRGNWIGYPECLKYPNAYADDHIVCSACEECFSILDNDCGRFYFCPHCGADMREES